MKYLCIIMNLLTIGMVAGSQVAHASPRAYQLTKVINQEKIDKERCVQIIRQHSNFEDGNLATSDAQLEELSQFMEELEVEHQATNEAYAVIGTKIEEAKETLNQVIEEVFAYLLQEIEGFGELSQEEQLTILEEHVSVQEWQSHIQSLHEQAQALQEKNQDIIQDYDNCLYDYKQVKEALELNQENCDELNACLLYPYSAEPVDTPILWENLDNPDLDTFVTQVDGYLNQIVPMAYRKLKYQDIFDVYNRALSDEELEENLAGKPVLELDDLGREEYSYSQELNLQDVTTLSNMAYRNLMDTQDEEAFVEDYLDAVHLKENQYLYLKALNEEALRDIQETLVNFLNTHKKTNEEVIQKIKHLHDKYQIKLTRLSNEEWTPEDLSTSGYLEPYTDLDFGETTVEKAAGKSGDRVREIPWSRLPRKVAKEPSKKSGKKTSTGLSFFQDELNKDKEVTDPLESLEEPKKSIEKDLPELKTPKHLSMGDGKELPSVDLESKDKKDSFLPKTGEAAPWTIGTLISIVIGCVLLIINRRIKKKRQAELEEIDLN